MTLGNRLVIRALKKASTITANVKKLFLSLAFSDLAVLGLLLQLMKAFTGPYIAGGRRGQLPPPGKLNVFFLT